MNVLLLAYYYPPDPAVGGLRAAKVAEMFARRGDTVHVLAGPATGPLDAVAAGSGSPIVHRLSDGFNPRAAYAAAKRMLRGGSRNVGPVPNGAPKATPWTSPEHPATWKRYLASALWLPDDRQGWILPAIREALPRIRSGVDLIYTTAPPFSTHLAGLALKRLTGVRWAVEFRDPWTDNPWKPAHVRSRATDAAERWLERRCLTRADHIVAVSEAAARLLADKTTTRSKADVIVARNGIDVILPRERVRSGPVRTITYAGNLYHQRDPRPFFEALAALRAKNALPPDLRVRFVGDCRWYHEVSLEDLIRKLGIADVVEFIDRVAHDECQRMIEASDLLLLFAQDQPAQVPNKLYEYLGARIPILAFVDPGGETEAMMRDVGGQHIVHATASAAETEKAVAGALAGSAATGDDRLLAEWSTERQMELLRNLLESA